MTILGWLTVVSVSVSVGVVMGLWWAKRYLRRPPPSVFDRAELLLQAKNYSGEGDWLDESGHGRHFQFGSEGITLEEE